MAISGRNLDLMTQRMMDRMFAVGRSLRFIGKECEVSTRTVQKYKRRWRTLNEARAAELSALRKLEGEVTR